MKKDLEIRNWVNCFLCPYFVDCDEPMSVKAKGRKKHRQLKVGSKYCNAKGNYISLVAANHGTWRGLTPTWCPRLTAEASGQDGRAAYELEGAPEHKVNKSEQLCWSCKLANGSGDCSWANKLIPVEGWEAKRSTKSTELPSYKITDCPKYKNDKEK